MEDKKELKRQYKETPKEMGVYKVTNIATGKIFVGNSTDLAARINRHKFNLKFGSEEVRGLMEDYRSSGEENFSFEILDVLKPKENELVNYKEELKLFEQLWIEKLELNSVNSYNFEKVNKI